MRNTLIGTLTAIVCALILFGAQVAALQDDSFIIRTENHTGTQSRWLLQALSDHPDAPQWGLSVSAHPNSSCPDGNPEHDLVYQLGANAAANGTSVLDPRWAALTLNWESLWCNISGQRMSEFQIRAITPSGARIRPLHIEVIHDTGKVNIAYQADWMSFGMPGAQILSITPGRLTLQNGAQILSVKPGYDLLTVLSNHTGMDKVWSILKFTTAGIIQLGREGTPVQLGGSFAAWNGTPPATKPTLPANPTNAQIAALLAQYGLVTLIP